MAFRVRILGKIKDKERAEKLAGCFGVYIYPLFIIIIPALFVLWPIFKTFPR